jgi:uncharacterized iron-regulated protein
MKSKPSPFCLLIFLTMASVCLAQTEPNLEPASRAISKALQTHDLVMLGEPHGNKQEYDWLRSLVEIPEFANRVDDIVMEFGNSLYQPSVDRYIRGEDVPLDEVHGAWRDTVASVGPPSPVYESLYRAVREANMRRKGMHQIRILCGDPNIDWKKIKEGKDIKPFLSNREQWYTQIVKNEVLAKHHRALLIMGAFHFVRHFDMMPARKTFDIEQQLRAAGANPYLTLFENNEKTRAAPDLPGAGLWC